MKFKSQYDTKYILFLFLGLSLNFSKANSSEITLQETSTIVEKTKQFRAACLNHPFHSVLVPTENKKDVDLKEYLNIKQRCVSGSLNQALYGVKNQNRLEKLEIEKIKKMKLQNKIQATKERIDFIAGSLRENLAVAEVYIHLLWLREYASIAKRSKSNELKDYLKPIVREIREKQKNIYSTMLMHDSDILINEFASVVYGEKYSPDEIEKAKAAMNLHWNLKKEISSSFECLALQKCFICIDKVQTASCDESTPEFKKLKDGAEKEYTAALVRYGEAAASLEKLITRIEKAIN